MRKGEATRQRMIDAAGDAFEREGFSGAGLASILAASDAPRGSLYFHFPGGKEELALATVEAAAARLGAELVGALGSSKDPAKALAAALRLLGDRLEQSSYEKGCPVSSVVATSTSAPPSVRASVSVALIGIEAQLAAFLVSHGRSPSEAELRASVLLSSIEGALLLARVRRSREPLARLEQALPTLLR